MKYLLVACLFCACADLSPPQIIYNSSDGNAEVRFGKEVVALGALPAKPVLRAYPHPKIGVLYLVEFSRGDSCPAQYLALLRNAQYYNLGEVGNCNDVRVNLTPAESIGLDFDGTDAPGIHRKKISFAISANGSLQRR